MAKVHLLVLCHGMWGTPAHLHALADAVANVHPKSALASDIEGGTDYELDVLLPETNQSEHTYDGIDWGGERIVEEILKRVKSLEESGDKKVTRFSILGYSLGGLLARYVIGALHARKFFDEVEPVNFNTIATPHLGLLRYPTFISTVGMYVGPKLLGRTGLQFYGKDQWHETGKPLVEVMAEHDSIFYRALSLFPNVTIYANTVNDKTVPFLTAAIEYEDPFLFAETNGIEIELDKKYDPVMISYDLPDSAPVKPPPPARFSAEYWKSFKMPTLVPPPLQFKFPINVLVIVGLPVIIPLFITMALTRLSLESRRSNKRIKLLTTAQQADSSQMEYLRTLFRGLEKGMDDAIADYVDGVEAESDEKTARLALASAITPEHESEHPTPGASTSASPVPPSISDALSETEHIPSSTTSVPTLGPSTSTVAAPTSTSTSTSSTKAKGKGKAVAEEDEKKKRPHLSAMQKRVADNLNALPQLKKKFVYINNVMNSHAIIIARDMKRFKFQERGLGVVRNWADSFVL